MDARSEAEFREFVEARSLALLRTAYLLCGDQHRAEDLVQGALAKLAPRWRKVEEPEAYVRRVLYHDQVSWWRRRSRSSEHLVERPPESPASTAASQHPTDHASAVDRRIDVRAALSKLGPRQRAVLALRYFEDLPEAEVAHMLGCSVGTVRSQTARALARLRTVAPELADPRPQSSTPAEVHP
ncbi:SigE family RNA polymerase sigma factor [Actinopolymorpha alba]|uniref:SigE family RNA polymerase sigma factor n=1 Tax=Actinopolymorpha alba TaxID=533267 RepID=UPI00036CFA18|nr:SigE family RNA polymerase sigma factor [Actinopolymorpha alba]